MLFCHEWQEWIYHGRSLKKWLSKERAEQFTLWHKKGETHWKTFKNIQKIRFFFSKLLIFERASLKSQVKHSCRSFLQSNKSDLLMVALIKEQWEWFAHSHPFLRAMRANRSRALFNMSNFEQKSKYPTLVQGCRVPQKNLLLS